MMAHTAKTTALLQEFFGERIAGSGLWLPQSPDLTLPDFCGDFLKKEFIQITLKA
jgi:hypothetical protein